MRKLRPAVVSSLPAIAVSIRVHLRSTRHSQRTDGDHDEPATQHVTAWAYPYQPPQSEPPAKTKKPIYKRWWFWVVAVIVVFGVIGSIGGGAKDPAATDAAASSSSPSPAPSSAAPTTTAPTTTAAQATTVAPTTTKAASPPPAPTTPALTTAQKNAVSKAGDYLGYTAFSRSGLIKQLEFDGFSTEDATFAVDKVNPDYNKQAAKKGKDYLGYTSFSHSGLVNQLEFDGFTAEQAEYGASQNGL